MHLCRRLLRNSHASTLLNMNSTGQVVSWKHPRCTLHENQVHAATGFIGDRASDLERNFAVTVTQNGLTVAMCKHRFQPTFAADFGKRDSHVLLSNRTSCRIHS